MAAAARRQRSRGSLLAAAAISGALALVGAGEAIATVGHSPARSRPAVGATAIAASTHLVWLARQSARVDRAGLVTAYDAKTLRPRYSVRVGARPDAIAFGGGVLWVVNDGAEGGARVTGANTVAAFAAASGRRLGRIGLAGPAAAVADSRGALVLTAHSLVRLRSHPLRVVWRRRFGASGEALAADGRSVWVSAIRTRAGVPSSGVVSRFDRERGTRTALHRYRTDFLQLAAARGALWGLSGATLYRVSGSRAQRVSSVARPGAIFPSAAGLWVAGERGELFLLRATGRIERRLTVGDTVERAAVAPPSIWLLGVRRLTALPTG